jgi:hypothetical protein
MFFRVEVNLFVGWSKSPPPPTSIPSPQVWAGRAKSTGPLSKRRNKSKTNNNWNIVKTGKEKTKNVVSCV